MMALSGVRSSWDMLARNSDLCWLATSSCRNRRAFWMASADWVAKVWSRLTTSGSKLPDRRPQHDEAAQHAPLAEQRDGQQRAVPRADQDAP